jgi:hypothetical protein
MTTLRPFLYVVIPTRGVRPGYAVVPACSAAAERAIALFGPACEATCRAWVAARPGARPDHHRPYARSA